MTTHAITVRIPEEQFATLTAMAKTIGTTLSNALTMTAASAYERGQFDINREPEFHFTPEQELAIERATQKILDHPEIGIPIEQLMAENDVKLAKEGQA